MSSLAPSSLIAEAPLSVSLVMGWSGGSMQTSLHTSDIQFPIVSWTSLWQMDGKPLLAQDSECSTEKFFPQAQLMGHFEGGQPYLRAKASRKADLCRVKLCSFRGRAVNSQSRAACQWFWVSRVYNIIYVTRRSAGVIAWLYVRIHLSSISTTSLWRAASTFMYIVNLALVCTYMT